MTDKGVIITIELNLILFLKSNATEEEIRS